MTKLQIAVTAAASIAILCLAVAIGTAKPTPALSARVVEVANVGDKHFKVDVLVTNRTGYTYQLLISKLEIWDGAGWENWADLPAAYSQNDMVNPHGAKATFCAFKHFKPGSRLRLVIEGERARSALENFVFRLRERLFSGAQKRPVDHIMHADAVAMTDEFREP